MTDKELRILFLRKKLENESKNLNSEDFFKLIQDKIGWQQYNVIYSEYANNSLLDHQTHTKLTELGKSTLETLEIELENEVKDKIAERKKLHNESVISGWKKKTFWPIFFFGLFGGVYSGIDLFNKMTNRNESQKIQPVNVGTESELSPVRASPLSQKQIDSLHIDKNQTDSLKATERN